MIASRLRAAKVTRPAVMLTGAAVADRALIGAATFLTYALLGRWAGPDQLGRLWIGLTLVFVAVALQESLITAPFTVFAREHTRDQRRRYLAGVLVHALLLSLAYSGLLSLVAVGCAVVGWTTIAALLGVVVLVVPCVLLREFARRVVYAEFRPSIAALLSGGVSLVQISSLAMLYWSERLSAMTALGAVGVSSALGGAVWLLFNRSGLVFHRSEVVDAFHRNWVLGKWTVATQVGEIARMQMLPWLLAVTMGEAQLGIYTACATLAGLASPLLVAMSNILIPKLAQQGVDGGPRAIDRLVRRASGWLTVFMSTFLLTICLLSPWIVVWVYGPKYANTVHPLIVLALAHWCIGSTVPAARALLVLKRPEQAFKSHMAGIVVSTLCVLPLVLRWGIVGAAYAVLLGASAKAVLVITWYVLDLREKLQETSDDLAPQPSDPWALNSSVEPALVEPPSNGTSAAALDRAVEESP